jgi:hypothetical protein
LTVYLKTATFEDLKCSKKHRNKNFDIHIHSADATGTFDKSKNAEIFFFLNIFGPMSLFPSHKQCIWGKLCTVALLCMCRNII